MRPASSAAIRGHCIWPSLLERLQSPSLVRRIQPEMVPFARATARATLLPSTSFSAAHTQQPLTNEAANLLLPFWKLTSTQFLTLFAGRSRFADERGRQFFCALARAPRLSARARGSCFFAAHTSQHFAGRPDGCPRFAGARVRSRLSSQAGSPHRHRTLRLHPKPALSRQRHPGSWGWNCHVLMDLCVNPDCLLCSVLFHRDAPGSECASPAPRGIFRRVRARRPALYSAADRRETAWRFGRILLIGPVQEKSRMAGRRWLLIPSLGLACDLAPPRALMRQHLLYLDTQ